MVASVPQATATLLRRCPTLVFNLQRLAGCNAAARNEDALAEFELRPTSAIAGLRSMEPMLAEGDTCRITKALRASADSALAALSAVPGGGNTSGGGTGRDGGRVSTISAAGTCAGGAAGGSDAPAQAATQGPAVAAAPAGPAARTQKSCSVCGAIEGPGSAKLRTCSGCRKPNLLYCGPEW